MIHRRNVTSILAGSPIFAPIAWEHEMGSCQFVLDRDQSLFIWRS